MQQQKNHPVSVDITKMLRMTSPTLISTNRGSHLRDDSLPKEPVHVGNGWSFRLHLFQFPHSVTVAYSAAVILASTIMMIASSSSTEVCRCRWRPALHDPPAARPHGRQRSGAAGSIRCCPLERGRGSRRTAQPLLLLTAGGGHCGPGGCVGGIIRAEVPEDPAACEMPAEASGVNGRAREGCDLTVGTRGPDSGFGARKAENQLG